MPPAAGISLFGAGTAIESVVFRSAKSRDFAEQNLPCARYFAERKTTISISTSRFEFVLQSTGNNTSLDWAPVLAHTVPRRKSKPERRMHYILMVFAAWLALAASASAQLPASPIGSGFDTLAICTPQLKQTLGRWVEYRQSQGRKILLLDSRRFAKDNQTLIRLAVGQHPTIDHLVLVGDAGDWQVEPTALLPTDFILATVNVNFGSEFDIATDNTYGDLNDDGTPELAVGRIAASDAAQLDQYIDRLIAYEGSHEKDENPDPKISPDQSWKRRINLVAGIVGFGQVTDTLIENTTRKIITDKIPGGFQTSMTQGSWRSPYCPDPRNFSSTAVERFNEGCMFWVYLGHGERQRTDAMRVPKHQDGAKRPKQRYEILDGEAVKGLDCRCGSPIAIFLACYAGAIDSSQDCLAEQMMKQPAGPIAVVAGSRVTMPYAMSLLAMEMSDEYFHGQCATVGGLLMRAKQKMVDTTAANADADPYRQMIETMGQTLSPLPKMLNQEKTEHLHLINLLGDPLLRLQRPERVVIDSIAFQDDGVSEERAISVSATSPFAGDLVAELVYRRDRFRTRPKRRRKYDPDEAALCAYQQQYEQAHDLVCSDQSARITEGAFRVTLNVPADVRGDCRVRLMLSGNDADDLVRFAIGSIDVDVPRIKTNDRATRAATLIRQK